MTRILKPVTWGKDRDKDKHKDKDRCRDHCDDRCHCRRCHCWDWC
jgi:hypothetical protein